MGYTTIEMKADKWYQVSYPFVKLDGTESIDVSEMIEGLTDGDTMAILDSFGVYGAQAFWVSQAENGAGAWCDLPIFPVGKPVGVTLKPGQAVFIHKKDAGKVTMAGKVKVVEAKFGSEEGNTWSQVGVVWPERKNINALKWVGLKAKDTLSVLDPESGEYGQQLFWVQEANGGAGAWCDLPVAALAKPVDLQLEPGQAVFINKISAGVGTVSAQ